MSAIICVSTIRNDESLRFVIADIFISVYSGNILFKEEPAMKHALRILTLLLAMVMVLSLAACAGKPATPAETPDTEPAGTPGETPAETPDEEPTDEPSEPVDEPTEPTEEPTAEHQPWMQYITADVCDTSNVYSFPLVTEPTTLEMWWPVFANYLTFDAVTQDDYLKFRVMKERTGVDVDLVIPSDAATQFGLLMASGDLPDVIYGFAGYYSGGMDHAVEEDVVVNLKDYESIMPNLFTVLRSNETFWKESNTDEGNIPLVPHLQSNVHGTADRSWMGYVVREDWMNELGMEVPQTYDQLEELLVAMKAGGYCEYPFILHGFNGNFMLDFGSKFWGGYNVDSSWYQVDGEVKYGPLEDGYRDYIQMLVDWRAQGLFTDTFMGAYGDGGFMTINGTEPEASNDSVGVLPVNYTMLDNLYAANADKPDYSLAGLPFLKVNEGDQLHIGRQAPNYNANSSAAIMVEGKNDNIELACKWMDYMFSEDGMLLYNYGLEGETFNFNENGQPEWIPEMFRSTDPTIPDHFYWHQIGFNEPGYHQFDREFVMYSDAVIEVYDVWYNSFDIDYNYPAAAALTAEEGEDYSHVMSDVETFLSENLAKFLTGARDMSEWDDFRNTLANDMNLDEAWAIKQASLDRFNDR